MIDFIITTQKQRKDLCAAAPLSSIADHQSFVFLATESDVSWSTCVVQLAQYMQRQSSLGYKFIITVELSMSCLTVCLAAMSLPSKNVEIRYEKA